MIDIPELTALLQSGEWPKHVNSRGGEMKKAKEGKGRQKPYQ
jgi:hypothetical protein